MKMSDQAAVAIAAVSTRSLSLDLALGIGGLPRGRIVEIFGPSRPGRRPSVYRVIAEAQRRPAGSAPSSTPSTRWTRATRSGSASTSTTSPSRSPTPGEQALEIAELLIRSGALDVVAIDSVATLTPKAEIEGEVEGTATSALQARLMSQALRKLTGAGKPLPRDAISCSRTSSARRSA